MTRRIGLMLGLIAASFALAPAVAAQTVSALTPPGGMVQQSTVTLDANGNATWTYDTPFPIMPVVVHMPRAADLLQPISCNFVTVTMTSATVKCWRAAPVAVSILGVNVDAFKGTISGQQVTLVARAIP